MNNRRRFLNTLRYLPTDRPPLYPENPWETTMAAWRAQGYPKDVPLEEYFGLEPLRFVYAGPAAGPFPAFEERVLSDDGTTVVSTDRFGRTTRSFKDHTSMPEWIDFPVKSPADLRRAIDERFDLSLMEARRPAGWAEKTAAWRKDPEGRDYLLFLDGGCYYGHLRNLCGVEYASFLFYDAPDLVEEFLERICLFCLDGIAQAKAAGLAIDYLGFGEDIAYKTSSLVSPATFRRFIQPRYRRTVAAAAAAGVDLTLCDSDGNVEPLLDLFLEAGVTGFLPCEIAAGMDPVRLRRTYGKRIRLMGGIDKREIAKGPEAIRREVGSKAALAAEGGYIPRIDHSVSSDIALEDYRFYIETLKELPGVG